MNSRCEQRRATGARSYHLRGPAQGDPRAHLRIVRCGELGREALDETYMMTTHAMITACMDVEAANLVEKLWSVRKGA